MRIALVGPVHPYRGGIAHYTAMLAKTLRAMGHSVLMLSFRRQYPQWLFPGVSDKDPSLQALKVGDVEYLVDSLNPVTWVRACLRIRDFEPHLTVFSWWTAFWAPAWFVMGNLLRRMLPTPLVFICHNVMPHEARIWDDWLTRCALHAGTDYVVQSPQEHARLLSLLSRARVTVVPHPIYDMFNRGTISQADARARLGLPLDRRILLFFGIVREYKGLVDLLEALPEISREVGAVQLVIAGEFWEPKRHYLERLEDLGIQELVRIDDRYIPNEEVPYYFAASDLVVAPHRRATGSGVVQMAIGFGVPLVTTLDWLFEGLQVPECYRLVPPRDSAAIATAVGELLGRTSKLSDSAEIEYLHEAFSWRRLGLALEGMHKKTGVLA